MYHCDSRLDRARSGHRVLLPPGQYNCFSMYVLMCSCCHRFGITTMRKAIPSTAYVCTRLLLASILTIFRQKRSSPVTGLSGSLASEEEVSHTSHMFFHLVHYRLYVVTSCCNRGLLSEYFMSFRLLLSGPLLQQKHDKNVAASRT